MRDFRELVERWEAADDDREGLDAEIRRAAAELFGPPDPPEEAAE